MATALNTENREYLFWQYEQLNFGLLGGLKIEGLERMRVTLKVEYNQVAVRHNLDLYNNDSLDKLLRRCAERFALGTAYLATAFAGLINELEAYRLEQAEDNKGFIYALADQEEYQQMKNNITTVLDVYQ